MSDREPKYSTELDYVGVVDIYKGPQFGEEGEVVTQVMDGGELLFEHPGDLEDALLASVLDAMERAWNAGHQAGEDAKVEELRVLLHIDHPSLQEELDL